MTADAAPAPLDVRDAAEAAGRALDRVRLSQRGYRAARARAARTTPDWAAPDDAAPDDAAPKDAAPKDAAPASPAADRTVPLAVTRARTDWGLAVLEWIEASVALAEAEDRRDPVRAARESRLSHLSGTPAGPGPHPVPSPPAAPGGPAAPAAPAPAAPDRARDQIAAAWRAYQRARRDGTPDRIAAARAGWRAALVAWFQALADQRAAEDRRGEHHAAPPGPPPPPPPPPPAGRSAGQRLASGPPQVPDRAPAPDRAQPDAPPPGRPAGQDTPAPGRRPARRPRPAMPLTGWTSARPPAPPG